MPSSTKWRFDFHALNSSGVLILYEVILYDGVTNLIGSGTATADSNAASHAPASAFDGNAATYWQSASATAPYPHWLQYEFASAITNPSSYSIKGDASRPPRDWTLSYWDGAAWVVADAQGLPAPGAGLSPSLWTGNATLTFAVAWPASSAPRHPYYVSGDYDA